MLTDLSGNILWAYTNPGNATKKYSGRKDLPDGDFLLGIGPLSNAALPSDRTINEIREVNLAGDTVRDINSDSESEWRPHCASAKSR